MDLQFYLLTDTLGDVESLKHFVLLLALWISPGKRAYELMQKQH